MSSTRRRPASPFWDGNVDRGRDRDSSRGRSDFSRSLRALIDRMGGPQTDPTDPVVNGASQSERPWLRSLLADLATQVPRMTNNVELIASIVDTNIFDGGLVDDKKYQMEKIIQLAASLPEDSNAQSQLSAGLIKSLWNNLHHPPLSLQGPEYRYRTADGSNNNLMYPNLGKAGSSYARTVTPKTLQPGILPDPGVVFDALFARGDNPQEHPNKITSMMFYLASIIIHDVFHTDPRQTSKVKTSSYLDLAPLYGSSTEEQAKVRTFKNGFLKPDTFSECRILGFPPGVSALLICFNRYHNYVAIQLQQINEDGRFSPPANRQDEEGWKKLDEDLFQTARLVTCGLYVNIILNDYVRTILNLNRSHSTWTLDPREDTEFFDAMGTPQGIGNQVSVEFNLIYRWHSATSLKDEEWTRRAYGEIFGTEDTSKVTEQQFQMKLREWLSNTNSDPSKWTLDFGRYTRNKRGAFQDADLVKILTSATKDVACAFGPRQVPVAMKLIEIMGIKQARSWNVATLNEFRKFFKLEPHKEFSDITADYDVQHALKALYKHPDYVELYPGLIAEDAKESMTPGSGICLGFTTSRTILADAVSLVRGDRFYTVDYTPANLTNWGFNQIKSDPDVAQGHCIYNLIMRALPGWYRGNSVYAMFPFVHPDENYNILRELGTDQDYLFDEPSFVPVPPAIRSWSGVVDILGDSKMFKVPWGDHITYLTGRDYMLGNDKPKSATDHNDMFNAIYCPVNGLDEIRRFYEALTRQLIVIGQERLRDSWFQLDVCRDVAQPAHAVFVSKLFHIPLKVKGDKSLGVEVDKMYLALSVMFAYVFLDADTTRSFRLRKAAKDATDQMSELCKVVVAAVEAGERLHVSELFHMGEEGQMLQSYGRMLIQRMLDYGWDIDTVVANLIPTAVAAAATQAQHMTQMIDLYLSEPYCSEHWPSIQKLAQTNDPDSFELLKRYALEANRLSPASYGLVRKAAEEVTIDEKGEKIKLGRNDLIYLDFLSAGTDPSRFPEPEKIKLDRPRTSYIHHGWGMHACIGREVVEVAMAAQLKVLAQLKNLRRAPGPQGKMKFTYPQPNPVSSDPVMAPGHVKAFMKEDWGDFWPFPTTLKVHHDGFLPAHQQSLTEDLGQDTGLPGAQAKIAASSRGNSRSRSHDRSRSRSRHHSATRQNGFHNESEEEGGGEQYPSDRVEVEEPPRIDSFENDLAYGDEADSRHDENQPDTNGIETPQIAVDGESLHPDAAERYYYNNNHTNGE